MKIKLRGITIDPEKEPVKMIFESGDEIENIFPEKEKTENQERVEYLLYSENFSTLEEDEPQEIEDLAWKDRWIRSVAEFENYKKRIERERSELSGTARRALSSINYLLELENDLWQAQKTLTEEQYSGIKLIHEKIQKNLSSIGIEEIQTESYDPDLHEVIAMNESGKDKIETVFSKGWTMDGKPLKYPQVILNKNVLENE